MKRRKGSFTLAKSKKKKSTNPIVKKIKDIRKRVGKALSRLKPTRENLPFLLKWGFVCFFWSMILVLSIIAWLSYDLPDMEAAVDYDKRPTVVILAANGDEIARYGDLQGDIIPLDNMSPYLVQAVLAVEDRRFYDHFGLDFIGLARAMWRNMRAGYVVQGGSTITQQLAKNLFLTPERTLTRKAKEALLAIYLEQKYSKDQILAAYLNRVYLGGGAYGVDAASLIYFDKSVGDLTLEEAAMIAGLLKAPSRYSPSSNPEKAAERAQVVIKAMVDAGYINENAKPEEVKALPDGDYDRSGAGSMRYYGDWIMSQLDSYTDATDQDLIIQTTLNPNLQRYAAQRVEAYLEESGEERNVSQAALVTMRPNGAVIAMIGGRDYKTSQFNRAVQAKRQPGSAFKPVIYLTGLHAGQLEPNSVVLDEPLKIGDYEPQNFGGEYRGAITLQHALSESVNTAAVQILDHVGLKAAKDMALSLGITDNLNSDLSMALGTSELSLLSLTSAYAVFANNGMSVQPYGIVEIRTGDGELLYRHKSLPPTEIVPIESIAKLNTLMQSVVQYGTGQNARLDRPVAGKTGTSQNYRDAWFMGYTPDYITGVWFGNDNNDAMSRITGGSLPARLWRDVMRSAHYKREVKYLPGSLPRHYLDYYVAEDAVPDVFRHRFSKIGNEAEEEAREQALIEQRQRRKNNGFIRFLDRLTGRSSVEQIEWDTPADRQKKKTDEDFFYRNN